MVRMLHCRGSCPCATIRHTRSYAAIDSTRRSEMGIPQVLTWRTEGAHDTKREGVRLGLVIGTVTLLWVNVVDALLGQPFRTVSVLGGAGRFAVLHYLLNIVYGVV